MEAIDRKRLEYWNNWNNGIVEIGIVEEWNNGMME
jgi:hypothetical protein